MLQTLNVKCGLKKLDRVTKGNPLNTQNLSEPQTLGGWEVLRELL